MAKNKKRHSGSARTYQDMKRHDAARARALSDEANLPSKKGGRGISIAGALVMMVIFFLLYFNNANLWLTIIIAMVCGMATIAIATYIMVRKNQEKTRKELK